MSFEMEFVAVAGASELILKLVKSIIRAPFKDTIILLTEGRRDADARVEIPDAGEWSEKSKQDAESRRTSKTTDDEPRRSTRRRTTDSLPLELRADKRKILVNSHFKMVFLTVAFGTLLCAVAAAVLAILIPTMNQNEQKIFDALLSGFTLGVGAILGLLGGKSIR